MLEQYRHLCELPAKFTSIVFEAIYFFRYYDC